MIFFKVFLLISEIEATKKIVFENHVQSQFCYYNFVFANLRRYRITL